MLEKIEGVGGVLASMLLKSTESSKSKGAPNTDVLDQDAQRVWSRATDFDLVKSVITEEKCPAHLVHCTTFVLVRHEWQLSNLSTDPAPEIPRRME